MNKGNCFCYGCRKESKHKIDGICFVPFGDSKVKINEVLRFFLYIVPNVESCHSPKIVNKKLEKLFDDFISKERISKFYYSNRGKNSKHLSNSNLSTNEICLKCQRYVCKKEHPKNNIVENDANCFFRHLRNSIAHGNVYGLFKTNQTYLLFEDRKDEKTNSMIVITLAKLNRLKEAICNDYPETYKQKK